MSRYIGADQNGRFDVRIQELVSKVQNPGGFLRQNIFFSKIPQDFELLKQVPQTSHQTGHLGWNQYIGTLILS